MVRPVKGEPDSELEFTPAEWDVLTAANEDWYGLWEVQAGISSLFLKASDQEIREESKRAIHGLLSAELIYLCWFQHSTSEEEPISGDEAKRLLEDDGSWETPEGGAAHVPFLAIAATAKGEAAWMRPNRQSLSV